MWRRIAYTPRSGFAPRPYIFWEVCNFAGLNGLSRRNPAPPESSGSGTLPRSSLSFVADPPSRCGFGLLSAMAGFSRGMAGVAAYQVSFSKVDQDLQIDHLLLQLGDQLGRQSRSDRGWIPISDQCIHG
jgi:hypothetical protein